MGYESTKSGGRKNSDEPRNPRSPIMEGEGEGDGDGEGMGEEVGEGEGDGEGGGEDRVGVMTERSRRLGGCI